MPSLRSERETRERREVRQVFILSRLTAFPASVAAGLAYMSVRLRNLADEITRPRGVSRVERKFSSNLLGEVNTHGLEVLATLHLDGGQFRAEPQERRHHHGIEAPTCLSGNPLHRFV